MANTCSYLKKCVFLDVWNMFHVFFFIKQPQVVIKSRNLYRKQTLKIQPSILLVAAAFAIFEDAKRSDRTATDHFVRPPVSIFFGIYVRPVTVSSIMGAYCASENLFQMLFNCLFQPFAPECKASQK